VSGGGGLALKLAPPSDDAYHRRSRFGSAESRVGIRHVRAVIQSFNRHPSLNDDARREPGRRRVSAACAAEENIRGEHRIR